MDIPIRPLMKSGSVPVSWLLAVFLHHRWVGIESEGHPQAAATATTKAPWQETVEHAAAPWEALHISAALHRSTGTRALNSPPVLAHQTIRLYQAVSLRAQDCGIAGPVSWLLARCTSATELNP